MLRRLRNIFSHQSTRPAILPNYYRTETPFQQWKFIKELGDGAFGKVHQAINLENESYAAVKVIEDCTDEELPEHLVEIQILKDCQQKNIIRLIDAFLFEKKLYIFLEYCTFGAVDQIMNTLEHSLDEKQIRFIASEILEALNYLHEDKFVIHRDIKASNILLTDGGQVKLADFGVSIRNSSRDEKRNEYIGTVYWMAPEVFFCEADQLMTYDYRVDIWSFGITLIEMAEMDPPNHEMRPERVGAKIRQALPPKLKEPMKWSEDFSSFLSVCLKRDPSERLRADQLQKHPFMTEAKSCHSAILYLLEEFRTPPVVELVDEDATGKIEENDNSSFTDEEEEEEERRQQYEPTTTIVNIEAEPVISNDLEETNSTKENERESRTSSNLIEESPPIVHIDEEIQPFEIDQSEEKDLLDENFDTIFNDLLDEVLLSDCEEPSIPDVILDVITEFTSDPNIYYSQIRQAVENNETDEYSPFVSPTRRQTVRKTRRFVGPDGKQEEIITMKSVQPFFDEQTKSIERKFAEREFRRLYHLEEKHRHQILLAQESELNEQQNDFNNKRRSAQHDFDEQLRRLDDRYSHSTIDRSIYQNERSHIDEQRISLLEELEQEELRSRYELLRKQTKSFYSFFRQMLKEKFVEQLKQFDEQSRQDRKSLHEYLMNEEQNWTRQWRKNQTKRFDKYLQHQNNDYERDYLMRKFQYEDNIDYERERLHLIGQHKHWKDQFYQRQMKTRDEMILIQKEKVEQSIDFEREKLEELQRTFEEDLMFNSSRLHPPSLISLPSNSSNLYRSEFVPLKRKSSSQLNQHSNIPILLRSTIDRNRKSLSWYSWPNVDEKEEKSYRILTDRNDYLLF